MKKFQFKLQSYLNLCIHREESEQIRLQELQARDAELEKALRSVLSRLHETELELRSHAVISSDEVEIYQRYMARLRAESRSLELKKNELQPKLQKQRLSLVEAMQKRKAIERLRERGEQEHVLEVERFLQQENDDLFLQRSRRHTTN